MATPDQRAADGIGRTVDGKIAALQRERESLLPAAAALRVLDIDAELLVLQAEKARIDPRRPPRPPGAVVPGDSPPGPVAPPVADTSRNPVR